MSDENREGLDALIDDASLEDFDWSSPSTDDDDVVTTVMHFDVGKNVYALAGEDVREIVFAPKVTPLPGAPAYVTGVTIHRQEVIGVLDLNRWFNLEASKFRAKRLIIVEHGNMVAGILTGVRTEIVEWTRAHTRGVLLPTLPTKLRAYAKATREMNDEVVTLIDIRRIIEDAAVDESRSR
jgi:purine-binding chemotaxis protein CheW